VLSFNIALVIANLQTISYPIYSIFIIFFRKSKWLEPVAKQGLFFDEIDDIYFDFLILFGIGNLEVKPLIVSSGIDIILQDKVISFNSISFLSILIDV
jgi:hypothetical protein